jgi:CBS domain-containing protein
MLTVATVLSGKPRPFNFIEPDALVKDALHLLGAVNMSYLVVMHEGEYKGIFCEHDFVHKVALCGWDPNICRVKDTMSTNLPLVQTNETVERCIHLFNAHKVRYIPVFDNIHFAGIITHGDLIRAMLNVGISVFDNNADGPRQMKGLAEMVG